MTARFARRTLLASLLMLASGLTAANAAPAIPVFDAPSLPLFKSTFGGYPCAVDADADGRADVVVAHVGGVTLFRSLGDGAFAPPVDLWTAGECEWPLAGDFDADGRTDFVVSQPDSARLLFFYGTGIGMVEPAIAVAIAAGVSLAHMRRLDGDVLPDLVTIGRADTTVRIYHATAPRAYALAQQFPGIRNYSSSTLADWNLDGRPDLLLGSIEVDSLVAHAGLPGGTFAPPDYLAYADVDDLLSGDFDGNPGDDLFLIKPAGSQALPSLGDGTFGAPLPIAGLVGGPGAVADFDADGELDLVTLYVNTLPPGRRNMAVTRGLGGGTYSPVTTLMTYFPGGAIDVGDVDADGNPDLLSISGFGRPVCIMFGNGDGSFGTPVADAARNPVDIALGDVTGDLVPDAVVADRDSGVYLFRGQGDGRFDPRIRLAGSSALAARIGDVNRDGFPDVVAVGFGSLLVIPGGVGGGFGAPVSIAAGTVDPRDLALGDLNGDLWADAVVADRSPSLVRIYIGGPGGFAAAGTLAQPAGPTRLALGRFDADALLDLAVTQGSSIALFKGNGGGGFVGPGVSALLPGTTFGVHFDDFDADGTAELAVGYSQSGISGFARIEEDGAGGLGTPTLWPTSPEPGASASTHELAAADFDGDGDRDVFAAASQRWSALLLNNGDGSFAAPIGFGNFWNSTGVSAADLDGDGGDDVVLSTVSAASGGVIIAGALAVLMNRVAALADVPPPAGAPVRSLQLALAPNPATSGTRVTFVAPHAAEASIDVYSVTGRREATRALGPVAAGRRSEAIPGLAALRPGLYWARVTVGTSVEAIRFAITR